MLPKKLKSLLSLLFCSAFKVRRSFTIQSGATFSMQTGAQVTVQGNVDNAGTLSNEGSLKVQGNYINTGTYNALVQQVYLKCMVQVIRT